MKLLLFLTLIAATTSGFCETILVSIDSRRSAEIYYEEHGQGKPIIILHRATSGYLEPFFNEIDGWRRIYIDPPGIGKSSADDWVSNADNCLEILSAAIQKILPEESFSIIGFSYFGYMARGIMSKNFERIDGMALICPVVVPSFQERTLPTTTDSYVESTFYNSLDESKKQLLEMMVVKTPSSLETIEKYKRNDVLMNVEFWNRIKKNGYSFSYDIDSFTFSNPSLILLGLQDNVVGYVDALTLSRVMPRASIVALDYASHSLPFEQNNLLKLHLNDWLNRLKYSFNRG